MTIPTQHDGPLFWRKSTASSSGQCVEVAGQGDQVLVRDSKNPLGPRLAFDRGEWEAFLTGVRDGQFDPGRLLG